MLELHNEIEDSLLTGSLNESSSLYICAEGGRIVDHYFDGMSNLIFKDYDTYELFIKKEGKDKDKYVEFKAVEFCWWLYKYIIGLPTIQNLRKSLCLTRKTAAAFLMIPRRSLENWEYGRSTPPLYVERYIFNTLLDRIERMCRMCEMKQFDFDLDLMHKWSIRLLLMTPEDIEEFIENKGSIMPFLSRKFANA